MAANTVHSSYLLSVRFHWYTTPTILLSWAGNVMDQHTYRVVGLKVGTLVGFMVGWRVGAVGRTVGAAEGAVGRTVGPAVGAVGRLVGSRVGAVGLQHRRWTGFINACMYVCMYIHDKTMEGLFIDRTGSMAKRLIQIIIDLALHLPKRGFWGRSFGWGFGTSPGRKSCGCLRRKCCWHTGR